MELLVIIDNFNQDLSLCGSIEAMMIGKGWEPNSGFTSAFTKTSGHNSVEEIEKEIKADVDAATFESEWKDAKYLYLIGQHRPKFSVSPGV